MDLNSKELLCAFEKLYPKAKDVYEAFCPYRICPIGAHIDHQYGIITGMTVDKGIKILYSPNDNGEIRLHSMNISGDISFDISDVPKKQNDWADYIRGAVTELLKKHKLNLGLNAVIYGMLPIGGLSSSAALVIDFLSALCRVNGITLSENEIIMTSVAVENNYVGVNSGKLDQACEILCKKDKLLYLDTKDDSFELIPKSPEMKPYKIAVFFSGVERTLVGSAYNTRIDELKSASYAFKAFSGMEYGKYIDSRLRDVPFEVFEKYGDRLPENWRKRAVHYYTEFNRVQKGAEAWRNGDIDEFGKLSFESGKSSIENYEAGSKELIALYEIMLQTDGIYGGRFSGAGFKGCCMALIDPSFERNISEKVTRLYTDKFPILKEKFSVHFCNSADGCKF